jgi:Rhodopirellula transposase DDE domain
MAKPSETRVYDLVHNQGFVNVGIDHATAEFAVESIRRWWKHCGKRLYPQAHELLITADGGESLGVRNKLWKKALQTLANEEQLTITVAHYPPATVPLEQDRASPLFFYLHQLARHTTDLSGNRH